MGHGVMGLRFDITASVGFLSFVRSLLYNAQQRLAGYLLLLYTLSLGRIQFRIFTRSDASRQGLGYMLGHITPSCEWLRGRALLAAFGHSATHLASFMSSHWLATRKS